MTSRSRLGFLKNNQKGIESMEPTIIQLAIDTFWSTIQSKELYMIVLLALILFAIKPWMER